LERVHLQVAIYQEQVHRERARACERARDREAALVGEQALQVAIYQEQVCVYI
jgi:hypothetical protein